MKTVQYLEQIRRIDIVSRNKLADLSENIEKIKLSIGVSSPTFDEERVQTSNHGDPTSRPALMLASLEEETYKIVNRMIILRGRIISQIEALPNLDHYDILFRRFVMQESFNSISSAKMYSWGQTKKEYNDALAEFERLFGHEYLSQNVEIW